MDYLDLLNGTGYQTYKGAFYKKSPSLVGIDQTPYDFEHPVPFFYEPIDTSRSYSFPVANVRDDQQEETVIKTKNANFYNQFGFVRLQDGEFYEVIGATIDRRGVSRQSAVYVPVPVGADFFVRLNKIDNPFVTYGISQSQAVSEDMSRPTYTLTANVAQGLSPQSEIPTSFKEYDIITFFVQHSGDTDIVATTTSGQITAEIDTFYLTKITLKNATANTTITLAKAHHRKWTLHYNPEVGGLHFTTEAVGFTSNNTHFTSLTANDNQLKYGDTAIMNKSGNNYVWVGYSYSETPWKTIIFDEPPTQVQYGWLLASAEAVPYD